MSDQMSLFGDDSATGQTAGAVSSIPNRGSKNECSGCGKLLCRCWDESKRLARTTDPDTSKEAAKNVNVKLAHKHAIVWSALQMMINPDAPNRVATCSVEGNETVDIELGDGAYTSREIGVFAKEELWESTSIETYRKRVPELTKENKGCIVKKRPDQICRVTGQKAAGYTINSEVNPVIQNEDGS